MKVRALFSRLVGATEKASLTIEPETDFLLFNGDETEAHPQHLRGTLMLSVPNNHKSTGGFRGVQLQMMGYLRIAPHTFPIPHESRPKTTKIFNHDWDSFLLEDAQRTEFGVESPFPRTEYRWPFELFIPGCVPESIRGCENCCIRYALVAKSMRNDKQTWPQAYKSIRISRTLPSSAFELMDAATVEGTWAKHMTYSISSAHQAIALGTAIPLSLCLTPSNKSIKLKSINCSLVEVHGLDQTLQMFSDAPAQDYRKVRTWEIPLPADMRSEDDEQEQGQASRGPRRIKVANKLPLPDSPLECSADADTRGIHISHSLHFQITYKDSRGVENSFRAILPITLFISPNMPVDASNHFAGSICQGNVMDLGIGVPPTYGQHVEDTMLDTREVACPDY